jgi:hypothetical protein
MLYIPRLTVVSDTNVLCSYNTHPSHGCATSRSPVTSPCGYQTWPASDSTVTASSEAVRAHQKPTGRDMGLVYLLMRGWMKGARERASGVEIFSGACIKRSYHHVMHLIAGMQPPVEGFARIDKSAIAEWRLDDHIRMLELKKGGVVPREWMSLFVDAMIEGAYLGMLGTISCFVWAMIILY